jgi:hypothetical protein
MVTGVLSLAQTIAGWMYMLPRPVRDQVLPAAAVPGSAQLFADRGTAATSGGGWYVTMQEDFAGNSLPELWVPSPHGLRNTEYWCPQMINAAEDGTLKINAAYLDDHNCPDCPAAGDFTGGIETRGTFTQAFGYFETRCKLPKNEGLWAAFWLQAESMPRIGAQGRDGSEIDIFESSFLFEPTKLGNCVHWDGYAKWHKEHGRVTDTGIDLYDGWHTYGLLWSPECYIFFVDGKAVWRTNAGGVSRVPSFLRLTVEIRHTELGPYGARLGEFSSTRENPAVFEVDYVKVYQHTDYEKYIRAAEDFPAGWFVKPEPGN